MKIFIVTWLDHQAQLFAIAIQSALPESTWLAKVGQAKSKKRNKLLKNDKTNVKVDFWYILVHKLIL